MYIAILGRQPAIGIAELERLYGSDSVSWFSDNVACITTGSLDFEQLGGSQKAGKAILELEGGNWQAVSKKVIHHYLEKTKGIDHKVTLGISVYGFPIRSADVQKTGLELKKKLRARGVSLRLVPNAAPAHNTAVSHHNKLGLSGNKIELLIALGSSGRVIVAESIGAQNITALAARDQARPKTDAFVGMLPPKLARVMTNLAGPLPQGSLVLDPFCGTGVVLQETLLLGHHVIGTDLSEKMVDYSRANLEWLGKKHSRESFEWSVSQGDATTTSWPLEPDCVVSEAYLGRPFSAPPRPEKLTEVRGNCNHIISGFLRNLHPQLSASTPVVLAVPAWQGTDGQFTHLPLIASLDELGYRRIGLTTVRSGELLYYRPSQVVARELLVLERA
jgi:tRNA (guanine10-N2)-dimethyltransferase